MVDREKVINGLRCLSNPYIQDMDERDCENCKYDNASCFLDVTADALSLLKAQEPGWISVKERLPDEHDSIFAGRAQLSKYLWSKESDNVNVYVEFPDGTGRVTEGRLQDGKWWTRISPVLNPVVTHWKPLPEPPKEEIK